MEFDLIDRHFKLPFAHLVQTRGESVLAGIGDDCASLQPTPGNSLYVSTDTLVEGVHFFTDDNPATVGWKSLACNLSDLAGCGAEPLGFTLNLSLPKVDHNWLAGFSEGLLANASQYNCPLVGGDTTGAGRNTATTISITVFGQAPVAHQGFHRAHAQAGDDIWVSGTPGLARLGLLIEYDRRGKLGECCRAGQLTGIQNLLAALPPELKQSAVLALQQPEPRIELGKSLRGLANAALDLSDGLGGDLAHVAKASALRADLFETCLESIWLARWPDLRAHMHADNLLASLVQVTLAGGDDFELCWTARPKHRDTIQSLHHLPRLVGSVQAGKGVWLTRKGRKAIHLVNQSYNHFPESDR